MTSVQITPGDQHFALRELWVSLGREFQDYGSPLENKKAFNYLGRFMKEGDDNLPTVTGSL